MEKRDRKPGAQQLCDTDQQLLQAYAKMMAQLIPLPTDSENLEAATQIRAQTRKRIKVNVKQTNPQDSAARAAQSPLRVPDSAAKVTQLSEPKQDQLTEQVQSYEPDPVKPPQDFGAILAQQQPEHRSVHQASQTDFPLEPRQCQNQMQLVTVEAQTDIREQSGTQHKAEQKHQEIQTMQLAQEQGVQTDVYFADMPRLGLLERSKSKLEELQQMPGHVKPSGCKLSFQYDVVKNNLKTAHCYSHFSHSYQVLNRIRVDKFD